ncbi:DNA-processing protein DprA [Pseudomonas baetica]|uniref:DNA-processing protein DprA n=1 Tax=Pseudomonas fluorescens group TaxID=136843 RepID=UPI000D1DACE7|nr:DNA-processing protein DprA [Pseudomonas baetica]PTC17129.1 DNA-processing protein DprA [Pseudomonas baetica]
MLSQNAFLALVLSALKGIGASTINKALSLHNPNGTIFELCEMASSLRKIPFDASIYDAAMSSAEFQKKAAETNGIEVVSTLDGKYSELLRGSGSAPALLFLQGNSQLLNKKSVAVIGTREPTEHGKIIAQRITEYVVGQGWVIVSGLAIGCDAIAHRQALDSGGGTVAVLAHGLQMIAPRQNQELARDIVSKGGLLVSEFAFGVKASGPNFVIRDKTQAGLSSGVIMIQSDLKGGSLHASRSAIKFGRSLIVPYPTVRDIENAEPKISANLMLSEGDSVARCNLLKATASELSNLMVLKSKFDYPDMLKSLDRVIK